MPDDQEDEIAAMNRVIADAPELAPARRRKGTNGAELHTLPQGEERKAAIEARKRERAAQRAELEAKRAAIGLAPFRALGVGSGGTYVFHRGGRIYTLTAAKLGRDVELVQLADREFWVAEHPLPDHRWKPDAFDTVAAAERLMRECRAARSFSIRRVRGRGFWLDRGRPVLHLGESLRVNGRTLALDGLPDAEAIYVEETRVDVAVAAPLSDADGARFVALCKRAAWAKPELAGIILSGWVVCATVGGALDWRPHVWIWGPPGVGKSDITDKLVVPALGELALYARGVETTAAGLRQELGGSSIATILDEAEGKTPEQRANVDRILSLARQASSRSGARILKGTTTGTAMQFDAQSCFLLASINPGLSDQADESRFVPLETVRHGSRPMPDFRETGRLRAELITPDFSARLAARLSAMVPTIRDNAAIMKDALIRTGTHSARVADLFGTLIAGHVALLHDRVLTDAEAEELARRDEVTGAADDRAEVPDEAIMLASLLQMTVRVEVASPGGDRLAERTLRELIRAAAELPRTGSDILPERAREALARVMVRVSKASATVAIGNQSDAIRRHFAGGPYALTWPRLLRSLPGAGKTADKVRLADTKAAGTTRAAILPLDLVGPDPLA